MADPAVCIRPQIESAEAPPPLPMALPPNLAPELSPREQEIARLVAKGYPNKTVAAILDLSPWTVATYLRRIYAKLGVRCRAAMVARLFAHDLDV